ncbi:MAG: glycosyltransferase [bacterium]|nr:glycosyltransferase [bacterium]
MKKVIIIEASVFRGHPSGGSFVQANYYQQLLQQHNFRVEIFYGDETKKWFENLSALIIKLQEADFVIGFGTAVFGIYLQWFCFILNKKGFFCVDTVVISKSNYWDHIRRGKFPIRLMMKTLWWVISSGVLIAFPPPKHNMEIFASCEYVKKTLTRTFRGILEKECLYSRVLLKGKKESLIFNRSRNVLFYGALFPARGVIDIVKASKILWMRGYKFNLLILGHPIDPETLKTIETEARTEKRIFIHKNIEFPEKYIQKASVVALPFRYPWSYQTPLTLLEPMSLGVPVVTTNVGSHGEWIIDGETGLFCKRENPADLAEKVALILDNKLLASRIAKNAIALLRARYDLPNVLLEFFEKRRPDNYWAKELYAKVDPKQYQDDRFQSKAGKIIDEVEKGTVKDLLLAYKPTRILDVATGPGRLALYVEKHFPKAKITGIDINKNMLTESTAKITFRQGDLYKLPFPNNSFDAIIGLRFSMHLPNFNIILNEFSRVLKNDGVLIFDIFNADSLLRFKSGGRLYKLPEICSIAKECGFQIQTYKGIVLLGETVLRVCPPQLLFLLKPTVAPAKLISRFSTKLVLSFKNEKA